MDNQTESTTLTVASKTETEQNGNALLLTESTENKPVDAIEQGYTEIDATDESASAVNIFRKLCSFGEHLATFVMQTRMKLYHIGKLVSQYSEERKCKTRDDLLANIAIDLDAHAKRLNQKPGTYKVDGKVIDRCLRALKEKKTANELGCFGAWSKATSDSEAKAILDNAANKPAKKKAQPKSAYERVLTLLREDIHLQASLEGIACECIEKLRDVKRLEVVSCNVAHKLALIEDKAIEKEKKTLTTK